MIIRKIIIINFRLFRNKTICFGKKPVVLLSAANGVGKTTVVDAVEWCLTGDIGRLKTAFDNRSSNTSERKNNSDGILKNRYAGENETVSVELVLLEKGKEKILCRKQTKDELKADFSEVYLDGDKDAAKDFLKKYIGDSFYNYHFCDIQKSFNIQSKKRSDLKEIFSEFITNYDEQLNIANNLLIYKSDAERYIDDLLRKKQYWESIMSNLVSRRAEILQQEVNYQYPESKLYSEERTDIQNMSIDELALQKGELKKIGLVKVKDLLSVLVDNERERTQCLIIKRVLADWEHKQDYIQRAVEINLLNNPGAIPDMIQKLSILKSLFFNRENVIQIIETLNSMGLEFDRTQFTSRLNLIKEKEEKIKTLSSDIELLTKNNKVLELLSKLSSNKRVLIEYRDNSLRRNEPVNCPVCGSNLFATIEDSLLLKEADEYIRQNGEAVGIKESERASCKSELEILYKGIIDEIKLVVARERGQLESQLEEALTLRSEIRPILNDIELLKDNNIEIDIANFSVAELERIYESKKAKCFDDSEEKEIKSAYQQILNVIYYDYSF